jgi:phage repressor protein C with HTH and peptisase S24 domain
MSELQNQSISSRTKVLIEKLLLGKFTLTEVAKITGISEQWLQTYLNATAIVEPTQMLF